ncbi:thioredoxin family protein [uncultured Aquitalea sp.]|uniref:thioredoxin family protein n=1 Tax=uncultured Aquitalea sp. TaxID=540272 RepID=UPI0025E0F38C|nr:thioredoxin family protein [uncultured Aquitalea sp.]
MSYTAHYSADAPDFDWLGYQPGRILLEFGAGWCPHCQQAQSAIEQALASHPGIRHIKVEDGKGRRLGRQFSVKLWPTLILLDHGKELGRAVRPQTLAELLPLLAA